MGKVAGAAALDRLVIPHGQQESQIFLLDHTKTEPRKVGNVFTTSDPWATSGLLSRERRQRDMPLQSTLGHSGHMAVPT